MTDHDPARRAMLMSITPGCGPTITVTERDREMAMQVVTTLHHASVFVIRSDAQREIATAVAQARAEGYRAGLERVTGCAFGMVLNRGGQPETHMVIFAEDWAAIRAEIEGQEVGDA